MICPNNPDGHLWQLEHTEVHYDYVDLVVTRKRKVVYTILALIPVFGWAVIMAEMDQRGRDRWKDNGYDERWYCIKCRQRDNRHVSDEEMVRKDDTGIR
jgi:hypothetical protein